MVLDVDASLLRLPELQLGINRALQVWHGIAKSAVFLQACSLATPWTFAMLTLSLIREPGTQLLKPDTVGEKPPAMHMLPQKHNDDPSKLHANDPHASAIVLVQLNALASFTA